MQILEIVLISAVVIYGIILLIYAFKTKKPLKTLFLSAVIGVAALICVNLTSSLTGVTLAVNTWTLSGSALVGIPGVLAMLGVRMIWGL